MNGAPVNPALSARRPVVLGLVALVVVLVVMLGWGALTTISGAIIAHGRVEVAQNRQIVQHPDGGVVAEIAVTEAQSVQAGDVLIRLDGTLVASDLAIVEARLFETMAHRARLEAERDGRDSLTFAPELVTLAETRPEVAALIKGQSALFDARRDTVQKQTEQLQRRMEQIASQVSGIRAQEHALGQQLDIVARELADQKGLLEKGLAQASRVLALEREQAGLDGSLGEAVASRAQAEGRATEVELEILRLADLRREEAATGLRDLAPQEAELAERRRSLLEKLDRLVIRAPVSGLVLGLQVTSPRSVIRAAEPLLFIVPQDRPLIVTAQLSPMDIDEVHPDQPVRLRLASLPGRTTPELMANIATISADALTDDTGKISYYRAEIRLPQAALDSLGDLRLVPGMPVEAFIQTGDRSPLSYLMQPFMDYVHMAFRES
ncbi:HlyD family type I secretion periplasmic adaptor subunit [Tabrizicola fusiformis]|uniref:HlyD family type I secretion periplasmic adaptor subunit n=1 Tax=Tabrizicola sp. SY72 TaxID=2741673 RepID=UPI001573EDCA|nr:HlyD family type I secretion periplasmic adaptor subunit [Tabrizicola sp. SY72]NTT87798.1 HlyD family type I secretion periplasmic adaptor subunit [Tabrizicola sp. SY72]